MVLRVQHRKSLPGLVCFVAQLCYILKPLTCMRKSLFGFMWILDSCDCILFMDTYTRNEIRTFTRVDVRQTLSLAIILLCSYQTCKLHQNTCECKCVTLKKSVNTLKSLHSSVKFELRCTVHILTPLDVRTYTFIHLCMYLHLF